jgi:hypothetical protein
MATFFVGDLRKRKDSYSRRPIMDMTTACHASASAKFAAAVAIAFEGPMRDQPTKPNKHVGHSDSLAFFPKTA